MPHHAVAERQELARTLRTTRPHAGTRCGDWDAAHLAAHLVLRERSVAEIQGRLPVAALQRRSAAALDRMVAARPYPQLVDAIASGPSWREVMGPVPIAWLWSLPPVREAVNLLEYAIHHEDVRRADTGWEPRALPLERQRAIWSKVGLLSKLTLRTVPVRLVLAWPGHGEVRAGSRTASSTVTVSGDPLELALLATGRAGFARLDYRGTAADVETVRTADVAL